MVNEGTLRCIVLSVAWHLLFRVDAVTATGNSCLLLQTPVNVELVVLLYVPCLLGI